MILRAAMLGNSFKVLLVAVWIGHHFTLVDSATRLTSSDPILRLLPDSQQPGQGTVGFAPGHACNSTDQCNVNSSCAFDTTAGIQSCVCDSTHYNLQSTCQPKIGSGKYCDVKTTSDNPCTENAMCYQFYCRCLPGFYSNGFQCISSLKHGERGCGNPYNVPCVANATCIPFRSDLFTTVMTSTITTTSGTAHETATSATEDAPSNFFASSPSLSSPSTAASVSASSSSPSSTATSVSASSSSSLYVSTTSAKPEMICWCDAASFYPTDGGDCAPRGRSGEVCDGHTPCVENAICTGGHCECEPHRHYADSQGFCHTRILPNVTCSPTEQCVLNANCTNNVCTCQDEYYNSGHRCDLRLPLDNHCGESVQCLQNGECVENWCKCKSDSYKDRNKCHKTIGFNGACDYYNEELRQCLSNTSCVFRATDVRPVCACDTDHFYDGHFCLKRAMALESCPSDGVSVPADMELDKQCVENAHCNTTLICECDAEHYYRSGRCPHRIPESGTCDPWSDYPLQCQDHLTCVYGACKRGGAPLVG